MMEKEIKAFDEWIAKNYTDNEQKFNSLVQYHGMETTSAFYSGYHNRDEELTRLYEENERLREALVNTTKALENELVEIGGCDHSVGICVCDLVNLVENNKKLIAINAEQGGK